MNRKLKSGEYRLYSRNPDPRTGKRGNLGGSSSLCGLQGPSRGSRTSSQDRFADALPRNPRAARGRRLVHFLDDFVHVARTNQQLCAACS